MATEAKLIARLVADNDQMKRKLAESRRELGRFKNDTSKIMSGIQASFLAAFGGVAIMSGVKATIGTLADFEYQMSKVAAVSGATDQEIKMLTDNAKELGAISKFTATEIGKLQEELARLGFSTDQIINMTDAARQLATVADAELGESAKSVGKILNAFGLEAKESTRVANVMAESFSKSALNLEQFNTGMSYAATAGKNAGFSLEQVTAMLAQLVDRGIEGSKAGTALRDIFSDLSIKGMTLEDALSQIKTSTDKNATAFNLFGKVSMNAAVILSETEEATANLTNTLTDGNRELSKMTNIMEDNLTSAVKEFQSAVEGAVLQGTFLNDIFTYMVDVSTRTVRALSGTSDPMRRMKDDTKALYKELLQAESPMASLISLFDSGAISAEKYVFLLSRLREKLDEVALAGIYAAKNFPAQAFGITAASLGLPEPTPTTPKERTGVSGALSIASDTGLPEFYVDTEAIKDNADDIIDAYGVLSDGFTISSNLLDKATNDLMKSQDYVADLGNAWKEKSNTYVDGVNFFTSSMTMANQAIATSFADTIMTLTDFGSELYMTLNDQGELVSKGFNQIAESIGQSILSSFARVMRAIGFKFIEAGAMYLANSALAQAATGGIPNPLSISNNKQAVRAIGIGVALGATGGILNKAAGVGSSSTGGLSQGFGSGSIGASSQSIQLTGQMQIKGSDLVYVINRQNGINGRTG